jgi:hypothetical protein
LYGRICESENRRQVARYSKPMTRAQRIVATLYCLLVVYCCVWIPHHVYSPELGDVHLGYDWLWAGPENSLGQPEMAAIALRLVAATALATAAFLLAKKSKAILAAAILAGIGCAGLLIHGYWIKRVAEHRTQTIHECAVAQVARGKCTPTEDSRFEICDHDAASHKPTSEGPGTANLSDIQGPEDEEMAVAAAEKECAGELDPKPKSAHDQIEEYKRSHGIK